MTAAPRPGGDGRRIRVLHVVQNLNYGGMERLIADIAGRADPDRFEMHVLALQYLGRFAEGLGARAELHLAPPMTRLSLLRPHRLAATIRAIAPDVVHTHSGVWYKASRAARMARIPALLHTDHGRPHDIAALDLVLDRLAARRCDAVVAVSAELADRLEATVVRHRSRLHVVPNGVDPELHRPRPPSEGVRAELGLAGPRPVIGSIGRLEPVKGYDLMLRSFANLLGRTAREGRPALVLAGDGSERQRLEELARELRISDDVFFLGWRDDVQALHATFDVFGMASRSEGTSVSLLEAMSSGICPVVTAVGGNPVVLGEALAHRLVPPGEPEPLAGALAAALEDPAARTADGSRARQRVLEAYDVGGMVGAYEALYASLARAGRAG